MRRIILFVLGIAVGAAGGASAVNALRQRDAYPRGLMDVMQHHYAQLREDMRRRPCDGAEADMNLLRELSAEIAGAVYGEDIPDSPFREFDARLHNALAATPTNDCRALAAQVEKIGAACDACHRQYR